MGQKILKSPCQKNSWNEINQLHIWTRKKFKTAKNAISREKFIDLFDFTSFFGMDFLKFSGPLCGQNLEIIFQS